MTLKELIEREHNTYYDYKSNFRIVATEHEEMEKDPELANNKHWQEMLKRDEETLMAATLEHEMAQEKLAEYIRMLLKRG